uniref:Centrosomal protein kizuna n=1 Tax=Poecilia formosa TaxID=48698 RepID=A0A087X684_POEFO
STYSEDRYYAKIASIQQNMHKSEKHRLELERELFAYSRSDARILQIKCSKLRSYLKEICGREARAKMRNLQLKRDVECMEISMKEYSSDHGPLQQQKNLIKKHLKQIKKHSLKRAARQRSWKQQSPSACRYSTDGITQQVEIFMDRQTSRGYDAEAGTTSVHSHQAVQRSPNRSVQPCERLPSGLLKDFRVGGEDAASKRAHLSDDISSSNDSPDGCNLSDKHEKKELKRHQNRSSRRIYQWRQHQREIPLAEEVVITNSIVLIHPPTLMSLRTQSGACAAPDTMPPRVVSHIAYIMSSEEGPSAEDESDSSSLCNNSSALADADVEPSRSVHTQHIQVMQRRATVKYRSLSNSIHTEECFEKELKRHQECVRKQENTWNNLQIHHLGLTPQSLSLEGLFNLLDSIEGRLHGEQSHVYRDSSIDGRQLNRIISLCDDGAGLIDEDLEACGTVVLHELRRLSWSTEKGCVLPEELVRAHQPNEISTSLPPNAARLWDRWFKHALVLKESRVLSTERLVQLFTPLLLERDADYSQQAKVLLRALLSRSSEEGPSAEDESDSSSLCNNSSALADADVEPSRSVHTQHIQELQSTEEDSQDKSLVESGPIRETKAYQLLKQSAMQKRLPSSEEEEENNGDNLVKIERKNMNTTIFLTQKQSSSLARKGSSKVHSALQTKDFWQESDDSDFEIEAALRPPTFSASSDGTHDFYH